MLRLSNVSVQYGHIQALTSISLDVPTGGIFSVLGANGAGKTTLLRSIVGLAPSEGQIEFDGCDIDNLPTFRRVQRGIALVPEGRRLFPDFTVAENLRIGAFRRDDRAAIAADIERICGIFPILKTRYHQKAKTLSGGEGQMLAIGRALMSRPKLLLLDEPSVGLMPIAAAEIFTMIREIPRNSGVTVLLVEQNAQKALAIADEVAVLELGHLVLRGKTAEVLANPRIKEAYLGG